MYEGDHRGCTRRAAWGGTRAARRACLALETEDGRDRRESTARICRAPAPLDENHRACDDSRPRPGLTQHLTSTSGYTLARQRARICQARRRGRHRRFPQVRLRGMRAWWCCMCIRCRELRRCTQALAPVPLSMTSPLALPRFPPDEDDLVLTRRGAWALPRMGLASNGSFLSYRALFVSSTSSLTPYLPLHAPSYLPCPTCPLPFHQSAAPQWSVEELALKDARQSRNWRRRMRNNRGPLPRRKRTRTSTGRRVRCSGPAMGVRRCIPVNTQYRGVIGAQGHGVVRAPARLCSDVTAVSQISTVHFQSTDLLHSPVHPSTFLPPSYFVVCCLEGATSPPSPPSPHFLPSISNLLFTTLTCPSIYLFAALKFRPLPSRGGDMTATVAGATVVGVTKQQCNRGKHQQRGGGRDGSVVAVSVTKQLQ
ncbi:hypothetical protein DFH07DRAFT_772942 [Mycena maculata]|uniref:Uncharacterized protein n=1 Tax=Mycena maculata TaxID=230809 RepID=A0AAD7J511_9AGAR|nr:hypothetical protein DFH07DRAFT_772942 [Mycena maculata]